MGLKELIEKYSHAGPRYTSYPTAPVWTEALGEEAYREQLRSGFLDDGKTLALYVHVPFCESLCYYCGCNIQITGDHSRSGRYVDALLKELGEVARLLGERRTLTQISWGGGTPTFLSLEEIRRLQEGTTALFDVAADADVSIEIDPRVTSDAQLELLRGLGFNRVSLGVQDFDERVQKAVNRIQSVDQTHRMLDECRRLGFSGINFDLIYGLPHQSLETFSATIDRVTGMAPSRIALYNYARLPNMVKHQGILEGMPMPEADERVKIFTMAYERLSAAGYGAIGMDHFAHRTDSLYQALHDGRLYRNFMGYVVRKGTDLIGVGASAIGELGDAYFQNVRKAKDYEERVARGGLAVFRGHRLSDDDVRRKWVIQSLMCRFELRYDDFERRFGSPFGALFAGEAARLSPFRDDGILEIDDTRIRVTDLGRLFVRNVAMVFDAYLKKPQGVTYSKTV